MTISLRNLLKTFGAVGAMCWLRKACGSWEWRRKLAAMLLVAALALAAGQSETQSARDGRRVTQAHATSSVIARAERDALDAYGKMALAFVPNAGQTDSRVLYSAQAGGARFYFTPNEAVFAFTKEKKGLALRLAFLGANPAPQIAGTRRGLGRINYMIGSDPSRWRAGLATYGEIVYRDLWPGIDLAFRGENGELKYEFHLAPGADPRDIRLAYRGAERLALGADGELLIHTAFGVLSDSRPVSYQEIAGARVPVASQYSLASNSYGIVLSHYDPNRPLVIDPSLAYSTYLGAFVGQGQVGLGIAVDASGSAYVTGRTGSPNFPRTVGAFDTTFNGFIDVFVTKLNPQGSALEYSTYLGGTANDEARGIAIDAAGAAYVTGRTNSPNFPTTPGAFNTSFNGNADVFVTKVNADGSGLVYSTFLGGNSGEDAFGITVDAAGAAFVTGDTASANFPTTPGAIQTTIRSNDVFVTRLNETGSAALFSTFLGGGELDAGMAIAIDASGSIYVTGRTSSFDFPVTHTGFQIDMQSSTSDAFVTKISNRPPNAADDVATTDEDIAVTIFVLANDVDPDGASLTLTDVTQGANGSVVINLDNTLTYSPAPNFNGADSFTYTLSDGDGSLDTALDTAIVTVIINPVNDPPVAVDGSASTDEDASVQINLAATDVDNSNLTFVVVSGPMNGALGAVSGASVTYTPNANFNGNDIFTFKASDGTADSNVATVTITVAPVNDPPEAANDSASTNEDTAVAINVLANDVDVEGNTLSLTAVSQPSNGAVAINPDGTVTYTPALNFIGSDSFTYTVSDGAGGSDTATVNVNVASVQDTPSANDDAATVAEDSGPTAINVLANDSDVDGDTLAVASVTQGAHGSVVNNGSSVSYTPAPNYFGPDSFTYTVSDGHGGLDTATVNVTVTSVNDAPLANGDVYNTNFNTPLAVPAPGVLANDADVEGAALTAALVTNVSNGTLSLASDGSFTYTPNPNFSGADSFTYRASDGAALSNVATVQITVAVGGGASKIVFSSNRDGNFEIYSMNTDGTAQTRLTNHSATDLFPALSPDGTKIAFASNRDGLLNFEIYVMNAGGGSPVRLTTNARVDGRPAWSPDGTKIAFSSNSNRNGFLNFEVYVMNADGSGVTRLTNNSALDVSPTWSPDGTKIAFSSNRNGLLNFEVYVMNADGSGQTRLTNNPAVDSEPAWSQDGDRIVFTTNRDGVLNFEIYVMNANGSGQTRLTMNAAADVSPDW